ncbi:hypothetical protein CFC21_109836 [Triticum aestivum]|uniref:MADS-box domain-containing protein n=3 Tax=Triticinae TaxID=1648030 RepID=A0A453S7N0_AEGTS|nr:uncharacterized protein LOC109777273 [Aegilops tauschii subsp. strangulata]XP_044440277.1 uncharacterized protein LOC123166535 [Triticum aestivum]KAF7109605.1 hypothetical protein CFC21_109836 [Triticum aestivum]
MATAKGTVRWRQDGDRTRENLQKRIRCRRDRLLQDAWEISELFAPHLAILAFPASGKAKPLLFGNPTLDSVLRNVLVDADIGAETAEEAAARVAAMRREVGSIEARVAQEEARLRAVAVKVKAAQEEQGRAHWWEVDVHVLGEAELPEFATALDALRADVLRRLTELAEARKPPRQQW